MTDTQSEEMTSRTRTADGFVSGEELIPHPVQGAVPVYDDGGPPDTILPGWRCPCCGETMPTVRDFWRADRNRTRLVQMREEHEFDSDEWEAYNEGVQHYSQEIGRLHSALPAEITGWVQREVL